MEFIYNKVHQEEFFQNLFPGLSNIAESVPPISISQVAPITPAVPQDTKSDPAPLTSEPFDISAPPTTIFPDSAESTIIIEAIQKILKRKAIINITALATELQKEMGILERVCKMMEKQQLITILSIPTEAGFLISRRPTPTIL